MNNDENKRHAYVDSKEAYKASTLHKELQATTEYWFEEIASPRDEPHQSVVPDQIFSPENIHKSNIIQSEQIIFRNIGIYAYRSVYLYTNVT